MQGNTMYAPPMTSQQQHIFPKGTATEFLQASLTTVCELYALCIPPVPFACALYPILGSR